MNDQITAVSFDIDSFIGPPLPDTELAVEASLAVTLITTINLTSRTCRWPFGDPTTSDFHYCGKLPQSNLPYCATHEALSRPAQRRAHSHLLAA